MLEGSFELRKWNSNSEKLLSVIRDYEKLYYENHSDESKKSIVKILGISWKCDDDEFLFDIKNLIKKALSGDVITKRFVLKIISSIYDPLGIIAPAVVKLKL